MKMNKSLRAVILLVILTLTLGVTGCGKKASEDVAANEMKYVAPADIKDVVDGDTGEYVLLDVRKKADYDTNHIKGAFDADLDAAKEGDNESGIKNLKAALTDSTGSETGSDDVKYALVCYSGKSYAQKGTDLLIEMGIPADKIFTLEGGMKAWEGAGEDYVNLLEK